jgi:hypothetical protein
MKLTLGLVLVGTLLVVGSFVAAWDKPPAAATLGSVEVQLPEGDLRLSFVESAEGMALSLQAGDAHVQARRLFLGDGKIAVAYEATSQGVHSQGRWLPNQAAFDFKHRSVVEVSREHQQAWRATAGEIYVRLQGIEFRVIDKKAGE